MRTHEHKRIWLLDRQHFEQAIELLSSGIAYLRPVEGVIGIARGGREPASLLAGRWGLPYYEVMARHNLSDDVCSASMTPIEVELSGIRGAPSYQSVLIVDDICGSGETLQTVRSKIRSKWQECANIKTLTLCRNAGSTIIPNMYLWAVRDWVIFPWERAPEGFKTEPLPEPQRILTSI